MNNKNLIIIIVGIIGCFLIMTISYDYFFVSDTVLMKNQTFECSTVSVPSQSIFIINPNSNTYSSGGMMGIMITPFNINNSNYSEIDDFFNEFIREDMSEINITELNNNAKTFVLDNNNNDVSIFITNNKKDRTIIVRTSNGKDIALKMVNSVIFPS